MVWHPRSCDGPLLEARADTVTGGARLELSARWIETGCRVSPERGDELFQETIRA